MFELIRKIQQEQNPKQLNSDSEEEETWDQTENNFKENMRHIAKFSVRGPIPPQKELDLSPAFGLFNYSKINSHLSLDKHIVLQTKALQELQLQQKKQHIVYCIKDGIIESCFAIVSNEIELNDQLLQVKLLGLANLKQFASFDQSREYILQHHLYGSLLQLLRNSNSHPSLLNDSIQVLIELVKTKLGIEKLSYICLEILSSLIKRVKHSHILQSTFQFTSQVLSLSTFDYCKLSPTIDYSNHDKFLAENLLSNIRDVVTQENNSKNRMLLYYACKTLHYLSMYQSAREHVFAMNDICHGMLQLLTNGKLEELLLDQMIASLMFLSVHNGLKEQIKQGVPMLISMLVEREYNNKRIKVNLLELFCNLVELPSIRSIVTDDEKCMYFLRRGNIEMVLHEPIQRLCRIIDSKNAVCK